MRGFSVSLLALLVLLFSAVILNAQDKKPRVSPKAGVKQIVGLTNIEISYSRPGVKGRKIWGGLVPYSKVWRAGADEATKITFSTDVMIEGKKLSAGSYSFFVIPEKKGNWTIIFNKVADQWGAFEYNEAEDALRVKVKTAKSPAAEWLEYEFTEMKTNSAVVNLKWENLKLAFKIEVKV